MSKPAKAPKARLPRDIRPRRHLGTVLLLLAYVAIPGLMVPLQLDEGRHRYARSGEFVVNITLSWCVCFGLIYLVGLWRFQRLQCFTPWQRLGVRIAPVILAGGLAAFVDPALFVYVWIGAGIASTWGLAWSEGTAAFLAPGPRARWAWRAVGLAWPVALVVLGIDALVILAYASGELKPLNIVPYLIQLPLALALLIAVWCRSVRARRAARAWIATAYPPEPVSQPDGTPTQIPSPKTELG